VNSLTFGKSAALAFMLIAIAHAAALQ